MCIISMCFRLGLEKMHQLTSNRRYTLRIEMSDWDGTSFYAEYEDFTVAGEADGYRLNIGTYSGTAGDSLAIHDNMMFTTYDRDQDAFMSGSCSHQYSNSGWWFWDCWETNLNGEYRLPPHHNDGWSDHGITWYHRRNTGYYSYKSAKMMVYHSSQ